MDDAAGGFSDVCAKTNILAKKVGRKNHRVPLGLYFLSSFTLYEDLLFAQSPATLAGRTRDLESSARIIKYAYGLPFLFISEVNEFSDSISCRTFLAASHSEHLIAALLPERLFPLTSSY